MVRVGLDRLRISGRVQVVCQHVDAAAAQRGCPAAGACADLHQRRTRGQQRQRLAVGRCEELHQGTSRMLSRCRLEDLFMHGHS